jgi:hypothetical protein
MSKRDFSQLTHNQLNNRVDLLENGLRVLRTRTYDIVESGDVRQYVTWVMRLTRGKLLKQINKLLNKLPLLFYVQCDRRKSF